MFGGDNVVERDHVFGIWGTLHSKNNTEEAGSVAVSAELLADFGNVSWGPFGSHIVDMHCSCRGVSWCSMLICRG